MYIPADLPVRQPTCSSDVSLLTDHEEPPEPFLAVYIADSSSDLRPHPDAFFPANQNELPVDSTTRLHAHRGICSAAYLFKFNMHAYLCVDAHRVTDLEKIPVRISKMKLLSRTHKIPQNKCTCSFGCFPSS